MRSFRKRENGTLLNVISIRRNTLLTKCFLNYSMHIMIILVYD